MIGKFPLSIVALQSIQKAKEILKTSVGGFNERKSAIAVLCVCDATKVNSIGSSLSIHVGD